MIDYIKTLISRLQQYSKDLNDTAIFAEVPWTFIDDDGVKVIYIFRRSKELLISKQGNVTTGYWEYLPVMQSLLIEHSDRKHMYNQGFVDNVVMALRKDGTEDLFLLVNQHEIPDLNPVEYLERKIQSGVENESIKKQELPINYKIALKNPTRYIIIQTTETKTVFTSGNVVLDHDTENLLSDGTYITDKGFLLTIVNGKISDVKEEHNFLITLFLILIVLAVAFFLIWII
ncbi:MAG: hypothetical protein H6575_08895 [Lewinellaceae bacterium]|nr:hypothetical protein [Lewinellaceae bacterium]